MFGWGGRVLTHYVGYDVQCYDDGGEGEGFDEFGTLGAGH